MKIKDFGLINIRNMKNLNEKFNINDKINIKEEHRG